MDLLGRGRVKMIRESREVIINIGKVDSLELGRIKFSRILLKFLQIF